MKQIKLILTTILLLLLLTSISYAWSPPNINSPVLLDETDGDPWGEELYHINPSPCCYNHDESPVGINMTMMVNSIKISIAYIIFAKIGIVPQGKLESDSILRENGNNNIHYTSQARGCE